MSHKYFICSHCGNIIEYRKASGVDIVCCGEKMQELTANINDASREKHVPVVKVKGNMVSVNVGSVAHPMSEEHHIAWIALESEQGMQHKELSNDGNPEIEFALTDGDKAKSVYAFCNLHGLWKCDL